MIRITTINHIIMNVHPETKKWAHLFASTDTVSSMCICKWVKLYYFGPK